MQEANEKKDMPELADYEVKEGAPFAALSYVLFLWIFTFIFKKENRFALMHARQGIIIFVGNIICFAFMFVPVIGVAFAFCQLLLTLVSVYGIFLSLTGKAKGIPLVAEFAEKLVI
ncbi:MAG: hypothetical protein GF375_07130 [Candidatus Omnitrophica bacterium]|nr:hypothetical protein [Candidatus Omnitrophota bacterium]MBD3269750.1 hypothetical protein [Candidatus Omnitrophota bacterium]